MNLKTASKARLRQEVRTLRRDVSKLAKDVLGLMADLYDARAISQNYKELLAYWKDGILPGTQPPKKRGVVLRLVQ